MIRLNDTIPGLPDWPDIVEAGDNEYVVEARHVSFRRYLLARWIVRLAALAYFCFLIRFEFRHQAHWQTAATVVLAQFVAFAVLVTVFPVARWLCWLVLRRRTRVRFARSAVLIDGREYDLTANVAVQFRASRPPRAEREYAGEHAAQTHYLVRFRIVEMVYGLDIVPIATVEYEDRAEQFAIALRWTYDYSRTQQPKGPPPATPGKPAGGRRLPE
jgi:hypothetical protein